MCRSKKKHQRNSFIPKNGFQYTMPSTGFSDHKECSIGNKIPFLMNLPSPVDPKGPGLGLSGKLTAVIKFFHY